jgi:hypothetical protein
MQIEVLTVPAAWDAALSPVPVEHLSPHGRRDGLSDPRWLRGLVSAHVGPAQLLRIALGHRHDFRFDFDALPCTLLVRLPATLAHRHRDLVARSRGITRPAEHLARHQQQSLVVIELAAGIAPELRHRVAKGRQHFG